MDIWEQMIRGSKAAKEYAEKTGQDHDDILFGLGKPGEESPMSIKELNEKNDVMPFVCLPTKLGPAPIPNCHRMICDGCRQEVYMSPATKLTFDKVEKKLILCMDCLQKRLEAEGALEKKDGTSHD